MEDLCKCELCSASLESLLTTRKAVTQIGPKQWLVLNLEVHWEQLFAVLFQVLLQFLTNCFLMSFSFLPMH